ncbi:hypothetical protein [uncultured Tateyamaria sp.]|uniref:hypothetical protein n=1 Tax=Tateyamaria sp. 1078 TaxID=3417464 RepID=UPI0026196B64|nr:hypothetical protein [uncultured Tateyamaria sp.]
MFGLVGFGALAGAAMAQSYGSDPIAFDLGDGADATGGQVLIAAYQPPAETAPSFAGPGVGRGAVAVAAGLPTPSIILGRIEPGREADFGITSLLPETVAQMSFAFDDMETRIAMRSDDPTMFRMLVEQGHIDPPADRLNVALQSELQRMNCYRSGIDGLWGRGSARSVGEYFGEREDGVDWPDQNPSMELFRTIIMYPDVRCEAPVAAAAPAPRATTTRSTTTRTTTTRRVATPKPAAPAPKPKAPANKPKITGGGGIGVFR